MTSVFVLKRDISSRTCIHLFSLAKESQGHKEHERFEFFGKEANIVYVWGHSSLDNHNNHVRLNVHRNKYFKARWVQDVVCKFDYKAEKVAQVIQFSVDELKQSSFAGHVVYDTLCEANVNNLQAILFGLITCLAFFCYQLAAVFSCKVFHDVYKGIDLWGDDVRNCSVERDYWNHYRESWLGKQSDFSKTKLCWSYSRFRAAKTFANVFFVPSLYARLAWGSSDESLRMIGSSPYRK